MSRALLTTRPMRMRRTMLAITLFALPLALPLRSGAQLPQPTPAGRLGTLVAEAAKVRTPTRAAPEYAAASRSLHDLLDRLRRIERDSLGTDDQIDYDLLDAHLRTRAFEID